MRVGTFGKASIVAVAGKGWLGVPVVKCSEERGTYFGAGVKQLESAVGLFGIIHRICLT